MLFRSVITELPVTTVPTSLVEYEGRPTMCGLIEVAGSATNGHPICVQYDLEGESYSRLPDMPFSHLDAALGVMNGQLWAAGGVEDDWYTGGSTQLSYLDKEANVWKTYTLDALTKNLRMHVWVTISDTEAFIMGGWDLAKLTVDGYIDEVFYFTPESG